VGIASALRRAADDGLMPPGAAILVAVSGGADSLALLYGCLEAARRTGWRLAVGHVHHGLRGREADRDLSFVVTHAARAGLPFFFRRDDVREETRALGISPEAAARRVRYRALVEMAAEAGADRTAVAHHRDDVAESHVLARERRGGLASLAGPRRRRADGIVRPLLSVTRREILDFLARRGIPHRRDASNGDLRVPRNRVRRRLAAEPGEAGRLAAEAARLGEERARLERDLEELVLPRFHTGAGATIGDAAFLAACPRELARLALSAAAEPFARPGRPALTGREREQILDRLASGGDFRFEAGRRIRFERRGPILRVAPRPARREPVRV
jgi:tRNA(Ile)-lysidine synthetase-like protein